MKGKQISSSLPRAIFLLASGMSWWPRASGSMPLCRRHWKGVDRGGNRPSSDPLSPYRREDFVERTSYATHITRHAGVKAVFRNRPRWPVAAVLTPCLARGGQRPTTGANSTPKVPGCRPWFTSFQASLGTCEGVSSFVSLGHFHWLREPVLA